MSRAMQLVGKERRSWTVPILGDRQFREADFRKCEWSKRKKRLSVQSANCLKDVCS